MGREYMLRYVNALEDPIQQPNKLWYLIKYYSTKKPVCLFAFSFSLMKTNNCAYGVQLWYNITGHGILYLFHTKILKR